MTCTPIAIAEYGMNYGVESLLAQPGPTNMGLGSIYIRTDIEVNGCSVEDSLTDSIT